ncbi:MAG: hypothetical protein MdMp014T_1177 [Treponematales bacterium]
MTLKKGNSCSTPSKRFPSARKETAQAAHGKNITEKYGIGQKSFYTLKQLLRAGNQELIEGYLSGSLSITAVKKRLKDAGSLTPAGTITEKTKMFIPRRGEDAA